MKIILSEKPHKILKEKKKLEEHLKVKIKILGKEIRVEGEAEDEYIAEKVIDALNLGFHIHAALMIKEEDFMLEILNIKKYTKRTDLQTIRARIIGTKGKTLKTLTQLTKCEFAVNENLVGIIGDAEHIYFAQQAITSLIKGSKQANVYAYLEKHQIEPIFDLGLKIKEK